MWTKHRSILLSRIMTLLFLLILAGGCLGLPWLLRWYAGYAGKSVLALRPVMLSLWACAIPAFAALVYLAKMLRNIARDRVFVHENVRSLRVISWCCFLVAVVFFCFCFFYVLGLILSILAAFMGLILRVVKNVFEQAIAIKEENDLTV